MIRRALWKRKRRRFKQTDYKRAKHLVRKIPRHRYESQRFRPIDGWGCPFCVGKDNVDWAYDQKVKDCDRAFMASQELFEFD